MKIDGEITECIIYTRGEIQNPKLHMCIPRTPPHPRVIWMDEVIFPAVSFVDVFVCVFIIGLAPVAGLSPAKW